MSCVTNPLKDRPSACPGAADAYGAKKAYTGEKRIAFIGYDPTTPRGELRRTGNRLVSMETATNKVGTTVPVVRLEFVYDYMGRRASKTVYEWETDHWSLTTDHCFVYDSWNLIKEVGRTVPGEPSCETNINYYTWGLDLSGSLQGAGGIGGLLSRVSTVYGQEPTVSEYTFDANGNVSELLTDTGEIAAHYVEAERKSDCRRKYDPYGKTLVASGALADENKFRFSTKPVEENTGLVLYEYRIYLPDLGRFGSKDPMWWDGVQETGVNDTLQAYWFTENTPVDALDYLGLATVWYVGMQHDYTLTDAKAELQPVLKLKIEYGFEDCGNGCKKLEIEHDSYAAYMIVYAMPQFLDDLGADGVTTLDHEMMHLDIEREYWNALDDNVHMFYTGQCVSGRCATAINGYLVLKYMELRFHRSFKQNQLECTHYFPGKKRSEHCRAATQDYAARNWLSPMVEDAYITIAEECGQ